MAKEEKNLAHAVAETSPELESLKEWWKKHGDKLSYAIIAVLVAIIGFQQYGRYKIRSNAEAFADLETARDPEALEQVIESNKSPAVTAIARLRLGQYYFGEGKYSIAKSAYEAFLKDQPRHPQAEIAKIGLAFCTEAEGNVAAAAELFKAFAEANPDSFLEPMAKVGQGRCLILADKKDEGKAVLDLLIAERAGTKWAAYADDVLRNRNRLVIPKVIDALDISAFLNASNESAPAVEVIAAPVEAPVSVVDEVPATEAAVEVPAAE